MSEKNTYTLEKVHYKWIFSIPEYLYMRHKDVLNSISITDSPTQEGDAFICRIPEDAQESLERFENALTSCGLKEKEGRTCFRKSGLGNEYFITGKYILANTTRRETTDILGYPELECYIGGVLFYKVAILDIGERIEAIRRLSDLGFKNVGPEIPT